MLNKGRNIIKNPVVYMFLTLIISNITYLLYRNYKELTIFIAGFFFIVLLIEYKCQFIFSFICIFVIGLFLNSLYYYMPSTVNDEIRIKNNTHYGITASYKGRIINIKCKKKIKAEVGERYRIKGKGKINEDFKYGIIGNVEINEYKKINDDFITKLFKLKKNVYKKLEENIGSRKSGLISSMSFGYKDYLDEEDKDDMQRWGIIHAISVSGLHVMLVYGVIEKITGRLGSLGITFLYVMLTGCEYSCLRAFIMLLALIGGKIVKRNNNSLNALCLGGIIILLKDPYAIFQMSFQLSFLATLGIITLKKYIDNKLYKLTPKIRSDLSTTLSAQVFTVPIIMMFFNELSLNFVLGNLLLVPIINIIVIIGNLLIVVVSFTKVFDIISYFMLYLIDFLDYIMSVCENFNIMTLYTNEYVTTLYCIMIISLYFIKNNHKKFIYMPIVSLCIIAVSIYSPFVKINIFDEGAVLVAWRGKRILCYDEKCKNIESIIKSNYVSQAYEGNKRISIYNSIRIENKEDSIVICGNVKNVKTINEYDKKHTKDYDIISFEKNNMNTLYILNKNKIIIFEGIV